MKILITGGAGFIGVNTAKKYFEKNAEIIIIDNLSRKGTDINLNWIKKQGKVKFYKTDIRDFESINKIFKTNRDIDIVFHFAAQVAVTTSVLNPREDFEIN
ncbi:MAG: SDR family NAD(P)-dependent oxidoreductase, partial [Endomicrobiia bacterium]